MKLSGMISTNKTTSGLVATIILVILLCQPNIFHSFTGSVLGRFVLIILILGITYLHMIFGVIVILVIIVLLSNSGNAYLEGFEGGDATTTTPTPTPTTDPATTDSTTKSTPATTTTSPTVPPPPANPPQSGLKPAVPTSQVPTPPQSSSKKETFASREGFSMTDRESNMLKGKNSKQIAVFSNARAQKNLVEPSDTSVFTSGYSSV